MVMKFLKHLLQIPCVVIRILGSGIFLSSCGMLDHCRQLPFQADALLAVYPPGSSRNRAVYSDPCEHRTNLCGSSI